MILEVNPKDAVVWTNLASTIVRSAGGAEAEQPARRALTGDPANWIA
jgi:Flp pilus assembly protein TadD